MSEAAPTLPSPPDVEPRADTAPGTRPAVKSESLFEGATELVIDHHGILYRLRLTSLGKLILTK